METRLKNPQSTRVPLSPLPTNFASRVPYTPVDLSKENLYLTPSKFESPLDDMESPYFTLR